MRRGISKKFESLSDAVKGLESEGFTRKRAQRGERPPRGWQRGMSLRAFCETYGVGRTKAYEEIKSGRLRAKKAGRRTVIGDDAAEEWWHSLPEFQEARDEAAS